MALQVRRDLWDSHDFRDARQLAGVVVQVLVVSSCLARPSLPQLFVRFNMRSTHASRRAAGPVRAQWPRPLRKLRPSSEHPSDDQTSRLTTRRWCTHASRATSRVQLKNGCDGRCSPAHILLDNNSGVSRLSAASQGQKYRGTTSNNELLLEHAPNSTFLEHTPNCFHWFVGFTLHGNAMRWNAASLSIGLIDFDKQAGFLQLPL